MARVLLIALAAGAVWYGWRYLRIQQARVAEALKKAEGSLAEKDTVHLEKDPKTGVYRPNDRQE